MKGFSASLGMQGGDARIAIIKSVPESIQLSKDLLHQIPWRTEASFHLEFLQGVLKANSCSSTGFKLQRQMANALVAVQSLAKAHGKCQFLVYRQVPTC